MNLLEQLTRASDPFWYHTRNEVILEAKAEIEWLWAERAINITRIAELRAALFQIQRMGGYAAGIAGEVLLSAPHVADEWQ